jgi:hypothetical protein
MLSQNTMISNALQIAILTRMASKTFGIRGCEDLGIATQDHALSPYRGRKPVPVMVDREMFLIWLELMTKKRKSLLSELKRKIMQRRRELWFEIFLAIFVLMSNLEFCYHHQVRKLKMHKKAAEVSRDPKVERLLTEIVLLGLGRDSSSRLHNHHAGEMGGVCRKSHRPLRGNMPRTRTVLP